MGCVVIEAPEDSGTLSIANFANDYDRLTMAVPGRTTDEHSRGTNRLIRNRKAQPIHPELNRGPGPNAAAPRPRPVAPDLQAATLDLLDLIPKDTPLSIDELAAKTDMNISELQVTLLQLDISGVIQMLPGNCYLRIR